MHSCGKALACSLFAQRCGNVMELQDCLDERSCSEAPGGKPCPRPQLSPRCHRCQRGFDAASPSAAIPRGAPTRHGGVLHFWPQFSPRRDHPTLRNITLSLRAQNSVSGGGTVPGYLRRRSWEHRAAGAAPRWGARGAASSPSVTNGQDTSCAGTQRAVLLCLPLPRCPAKAAQASCTEPSPLPTAPAWPAQRPKHCTRQHGVPRKSLNSNQLKMGQALSSLTSS